MPHARPQMRPDARTRNLSKGLTRHIGVQSRTPTVVRIPPLQRPNVSWEMKRVCDLMLRCTIYTHGSKLGPIFYGCETPLRRLPPLILIPPLIRTFTTSASLRSRSRPGFCPRSISVVSAPPVQAVEQRSRRYGRIEQIGLLDPASYPFASH